MKIKLKEDLKSAMKAQDKITMSVVRGVLSAIQYEEMQKGTEEIGDEASLVIIKNELKKRKESLEFSEKANRADEVTALKSEIAVLEKYLPSQITGIELEKIITEILKESGNPNLGLIMKGLKDKYFGQYDSKEASEIAKKIIG
jgi:uncharacterized protein YqeY